jgi:hypothetical protein
MAYDNIHSLYKTIKVWQKEDTLNMHQVLMFHQSNSTPPSQEQLQLTLRLTINICIT